MGTDCQTLRFLQTLRSLTQMAAVAATIGTSSVLGANVSNEAEFDQTLADFNAGTQTVMNITQDITLATNNAPTIAPPNNSALTIRSDSAPTVRIINAGANKALNFDIATGQSTAVTFNAIQINGGTGGVSLQKNGGGDLTIVANSLTTNNVTVHAGTMTLSSGQINSGPFVVDAGTFYNNGSIQTGINRLTITTGGIYAGNGTVTPTSSDVRLADGGSISPGRQPGEINQLNFGSGLIVRSGSGNLFLIDSSGTNTDLINVTGLFTVNSGASASLFVHGVGAKAFVVGQQYKFIDAVGGVSATSADFTSATSDAGTIIVVVDANAVYFVFTVVNPNAGFAAIAQTPNEWSVGNYLDQVTQTASGDFAIVTDQLATLNADQQRAAMNQMSGEAHGTAGQTTINTTTLSMQQVANHLSSASMAGPAGGGTSTNLMAPVSSTSMSTAAPNNVQQVRYTPGAALSETKEETSASIVCGCCKNEKLWNGWSVGYGLGGSAQGDGNASGASYGVGGFLAGVDRWLDDSTMVGVFGGYLGSGFTTGTPSANVHDNAGQGGIYAQRRGDVLYVSGLLGGQADNYTSRRNINFGTINRTATGNYDGWQGFGYSEAGANVTAGNTTLQPFAALQYIHLRQNSISETGAGSLNLASGGIDTDSLRSFLGTRLRYDNQGENNFRRFVPELQASWLHEYIDSSSTLNARFGAVGGSGFNVSGLNVGRDWALLGAGLTYVISDNLRLTANYYAQTNDRQTYHVGAGGLSIQW